MAHFFSAIHFKPLSISKSLAVRQANADLIGQLIKIRGMVTRISEVRPAVKVAAYTCSMCGVEIFQEVLQALKHFLIRFLRWMAHHSSQSSNVLPKAAKRTKPRATWPCKPVVRVSCATKKPRFKNLPTKFRWATFHDPWSSTCLVTWLAPCRLVTMSRWLV